MPRLGLAKLMSEFQIREVVDYHKLPPGMKSNFISRLYSELDKVSKTAIQSIKNADGIKLHFIVETDPKGVCITNLPNDAFLRKMAFYANLTLITFPFHETEKEYQTIVKRDHKAKLIKDSDLIVFGKYKTKRSGYGGEVEELDGSHHLYKAEFDSFLHLLCTARSFLDSEMLLMLPSYHPEAMRMSRKPALGYGLISANFRLGALRRQFTEEGIENLSLAGSIIPYLYLPYFTNIDAEDVISIRREEKDLYVDFQRKLNRLIGELPRMKSEQALLQEMEEIDTGVRSLMKRYEVIQSTVRKKNPNSVIGFIGLGLAMLAPPELRRQLASLAEHLPALDYFELRKPGEAATSKLRGEEFYLMWRLVDPKHNR